MIGFKRYIDRYETWKYNVQTASRFVFVCGLIAALYFGCRVILIASPVVAIEQSIFNPPSHVNALCMEGDESKLTETTPILSNTYQSHIKKQAHVGPNLVLNSDLSRIDPETGQPAEYTHTVDDEGVSYQFLQEGEDQKRFLRMINTKKVLTGQVEPAWQHTSSVIPPTVKTYAYSFSYRSTVPVKVSVEFIKDDKSSFTEAYVLEASSVWQSFNAHFNNISGAAAVRLNIHSAEPGQIDTNDFDVHEIPQAELQKGMVTITFDDGWKSVDTEAASLFDKYNIRTTQYIITEIANYKTAGYMNYDAIRHLKKKGHEIGSHSLNHCNQIDLSTDALKDNATKSKQALEKEKLGSVRSFAYPLGQYNKTTQHIYEKEYPLIRTSDFGYNDRYFDPTNIRSIGIVSTTTDKEFQSWLDYAKKHNLWVIFVYHRINESGEYSVTKAKLESQLKMVSESGLTILPLGEAADLAKK